MNEHTQYLHKQAYLLGIDDPQVKQGIDSGVLWHSEQLRIISSGIHPTLAELQATIREWAPKDKQAKRRKWHKKASTIGY